MFSSRERGKKLKFQQLEHFYLPFRMLQNTFQRTNVFNTYQRQEPISREEPGPEPHEIVYDAKGWSSSFITS